MPEEIARLEEEDRRLLNLLQREFPLAAEPFAALAAKLETTEEDVLERVCRLKQEKVIRQIGAIFDSYRLGYKSCLVAAAVPPERLEAAAAAISRHPGVSHNYERSHAYNLWFTITLPPTKDLQTEVDRLQAESGALTMRLLPTLRLFKIGVKLDMGDEAEAPRKEEQQTGHAGTAPTPLTPQEIAAVRALQKDLPLGSRPFVGLADGSGLSEAELLEHARAFLADGRMRRFAAVLHHRRAGYSANGMGVWNVPDDQVAEAGAKMSAFAAVSHCYHRPRYPDWPYNLFTMIHARTPEECQSVAAAISAETGITEYGILYSTREFKKVRVRYFES